VSEATETLDAVTRLVQAVKSSETTMLANVLQPLVAAFLESERDRKAKEFAREHDHPVKPDVDVYALEHYVSLCKSLNLDHKDPGTRAILKNLGKDGT
jgi:hypothetical protein